MKGPRWLRRVLWALLSGLCLYAAVYAVLLLAFVIGEAFWPVVPLLLALAASPFVSAWLALLSRWRDQAGAALGAAVLLVPAAVFWWTVATSEVWPGSALVALSLTVGAPAVLSAASLAALLVRAGLLLARR